MKTLFVAGTDTAVGKTVVAGALAATWVQKGFRVAVMKPISCGGLGDARFLSRMAQSSEPMSVTNPIALRDPLSPNVAARRQRVKIDLRKIDDAYRSIQKKSYEYLIVEGCGGLLVPITANFYVIDLIRRLNAQTLLVSRAGLGAINHTLLSLEALQRRSLRPLGIIYSQTQSKPLTIAAKTNPHVIESLSGVRSMGIFPYLSDKNSQNLVRTFSKHIALEKIL